MLLLIRSPSCGIFADLLDAAQEIYLSSYQRMHENMRLRGRGTSTLVLMQQQSILKMDASLGK